jgi:hypothetical protein
VLFDPAILFSGRTKWQNALLLFAGILLLMPLALRSMAAFTKAKQACVNIYEQQFQMAQLVSQLPGKSVVAANDIGAVSFYTGAEVVDLWGLGSIEVARSRRQARWDADFLNGLMASKHVQLVMIYDSWFGDKIHPSWKKVATWKIQNNVICGDDTVTFYTTGANSSTQVKEVLLRYQPKLPATVEVKYY